MVLFGMRSLILIGVRIRINRYLASYAEKSPGKVEEYVSTFPLFYSGEF